MNYKKLDLTEKFGQTILLGLDTYEITDEIINIINNYHIGGVILYKKNYTSIESMIEFVNKLKVINKNNKLPLFIAVDQENGRVNRFPKEITRMYNARKLANTKNMTLINECNKLTTFLLKNVGVNMNFAPDLDIVRNDKSKDIGDRSYGSTKEDVLKYGLPFMNSLQKNNIVSVIKHFPGHGATNNDSHFTIPKIRDLNTLEKEDLKVFEYSFKNGADAIMVGHLKLKGYGFKPASINKRILDDYLFNKYKFSGLVITDDLRMNFLHRIYGLKRCIKKSFEAGNNMIMIKYKKGDLKLFKRLNKMVNMCEIDPEKIYKSAKKIMEYKIKYNVTDDVILNKMNISKINERIKAVNELIDKEIIK